MRAQLAGGSGLGRLRSSMPSWTSLEEAAVEAHGDASAGEVVADGVLAAGEADQAGGVDQPVDLDRVAGSPAGMRWWSGRAATVGEQLLQVGDGQPGRHGLEPDAVGEQVHDGGVGPEA